MSTIQLLLEGKSDDLIKDFYKEMDRYSSKKNYERAAIYRDRISALRDIQRSQSVAGFTDNKDAISVKSTKGKIRIGFGARTVGEKIKKYKNNKKKACESRSEEKGANV